MSMRRFELVEGSSSKFWEIWIEGNDVHTSYGRIGAQGQTTIKEAGSPEAAKKAYDALVAEKTKKGYVEKTDGAAPAAKKADAAGASDQEYATLIAKIEAKAKKAGVELSKGASEKAIAAAEKALGQVLPDEVKAFYRRHDGSEDDSALEWGELLSLERMVDEWKVWKGLLDDGTFESNDHGEPGKGVRKHWWIPEWIPFTYDGAGNHKVIDLAPAKGGVRGQIVDFWHDDGSRTVAGKSFLQWLADANWGAGGEDEEDEGESEGFRRFELDEKFWSIRLDPGETSFTVRFGKQGTEGQEKTKDFDDAAAAKKEYDKLVAEKVKKGYEEV
jgi:predicted DNA-binding WGR domain protein/cell wall assembly regulator SMI1